RSSASWSAYSSSAYSFSGFVSVSAMTASFADARSARDEHDAWGGTPVDDRGMARVIGFDVVVVEFADVVQPLAAPAGEDSGTTAAGGAERLERIVAVVGKPGVDGGLSGFRQGRSLPLVRWVVPERRPGSTRRGGRVVSGCAAPARPVRKP